MVELVRRIARRLRLLTRIEAHERAMDEEMRLHLELEAAELQRSGVPEAEARRLALLAFGGIERFKEEGRDARGTRLIEDLWQDLRYAARQLRRNPGFSAAIILTLALGIGAFTTLHSYLRYISSDGSVLQPADRLVFLGQGPPDCTTCLSMAAGNYLTIREEAKSLELVSMFADWEPVFRGSDRAELLDGARVTPEFFRTLGISPILGRTLVPEDAADRNPVVVLTEGAWRSRFGGAADVLGQPFVLDRIPYTVVGVVPDDAVYPRDTEFWTPLILEPELAAERVDASYRVVGRLREGATARAAAAEITRIGALVAADAPEMEDATFTLTSLLELDRWQVDGVVLVFGAAVGVTLLIAWINLAGLLIARLSARRRELAVRRSLGAASGRIVRQLLVESMLLTALGGTCGALLAVWGTRRLIGWPEVRVDLYAFGAALAIGLFSGVVIGLWPSIRSLRPQLQQELRAAPRSTTGSSDAVRGRRALVVTQVALTVLLLAAAGALARSFRNIHDVHPGFTSQGLLVSRVWTPPAAPGTPAVARGIDQLMEAIERIPGVEKAGASLGIPFGHGAGTADFEMEGRDADPAVGRLRARMQAATPGYFDALGVPLLRGRPFTGADRSNSPPVAVVNHAFVERYFGGDEAIGRGLVMDGRRWEIVGVVGTVFYGDVAEMESPEIYRPMTQWGRSNAWITVRAGDHSNQVRSALAEAVRRFDPDMAITRQLTMDELRRSDMSSERLALRLIGAFAIAGLLIAAIGLYGLISFSVAQRTREFGVRLALGARPAAVLRLVLREGLRLAVMGAVVGVLGGLVVLRVMRSMVFRVSAVDPFTLGAVVAVVCAVALVAAYLPAQRAMLVDPVRSITAE